MLRSPAKRCCVVHDNAHLGIVPHVAMLQQSCFVILEHPPHGTDLVQSRIHLFGLLRDALKGCCFASDYKLKDVMHMWPAT
jgi:hypothetical protein